jgi:hypothetical protein
MNKYFKVGTVHDITIYSYMCIVHFLFCDVILELKQAHTFHKACTVHNMHKITTWVSSKLTLLSYPSIKLPPKFQAVSTCLATHLRDISGADNLVSSGNL